jgi:hypothetical protein
MVLFRFLFFIFPKTSGCFHFTLNTQFAENTIDNQLTDIDTLNNSLSLSEYIIS